MKIARQRFTVSALLWLIPFFTFAPQVYSQHDPWIFQNTPITEGTLFDIFFVDDSNGWAVGRDEAGEKAAIIHTINGSDQWLLQDNPLAGSLNAIYILDDSVGYAAGQNWDGGNQIAMLKTTNAGQTWLSQTLPSISGDLKDVFFTSANNG